MSLTFFEIKATAPKEKPFKLSDGDGLYLLIQPNGKKFWRFRYRFAGIEKMLAIGPFPAISLADARKLLINGVDPSALGRAARERDG